MTLNLSKRSSNYYLYEIDRVKDDLTGKFNYVDSRCDAIDVDIADVNTRCGIIEDGLTNVSDALDALSFNPNTNVQTNDPFPLTADNNIKPWGPDLIAYYSFSDPLNLGRDSTGYGRNGVTKGAQYSTDVSRNHCAVFSPIINANANNAYSNQKVIELSDHASAFSVPQFTISLWYYCTTAAGNNAVFSLVDSTNALSHFSILHSAGNTRILCYVNGVVKLDLTASTTENAFHHIVVAMGVTGNRIYIDNVLQSTYVNSTSNTSYVDFFASSATGFIPNAVTIGATRGPDIMPLTGGNPGALLEPQYKFPLNGRVSDVTFWDRALSVTECSALYNDNYGYSVFILAGQSNMMGLGTSATSIPFDYDYSLFNGRVYQYDTYNNINHTAGTISAGNLYTPLSPYNAVTNTILPITTTGAVKNLQHPGDIGTAYGQSAGATVGLWKTFTDNLVQYGSIPYRKKILLMPCAIGSTGFLSQWSPTMLCYEVTKNACNAVLDHNATVLNKFNTLAGFLWNQGEQSCVEVDVNFKNNFLAMLAGFQADIPGFGSDIPIVVAQLAGNNYEQYFSTASTPNKSMKKLVNDAYAELDATYANITLVKTLGEATYQSDVKHYDSAYYRTIGYKYFDAYCTSSGMPNRKVIDSDKVMVVNKTFGSRNIGFNVPIYLPPHPVLDTASITYTSLPIGGCVQCVLVSVTGTGLKTGGVTGISFTFTKLGPLVIMAMTTAIAFTVDAGTGTTLTFATGTIPSAYRPIIDTIVTCSGRLNGSSTNTSVIDVRIDNDGSIVFTPSGGGSFTNLQAQYISAFTACFTAGNNF